MTPFTTDAVHVLSNFVMTWQDAQNYCEEQGGFLAVNEIRWDRRRYDIT